MNKGKIQRPNVRGKTYDSVNGLAGSSGETKCLQCLELIHNWFRAKSVWCFLHSL